MPHIPPPSTLPPGSIVVAYLRDSGHEKQELSTEQQEHAIRVWCLENGLTIQEIYKDEARRGSTDVGRDALAQMMNDLRHSAPVAGVVVWSNSRFARKIIHAQFYRAEIRKLGYIFYSITDKIADGPEAIIFEAIADYKNQRYVEDMSIDVKRGLHQLVEQFGCVPGTPPKGFVRQPVTIAHHRDGKPRIAHRWVPDPDLSPRVLLAFEMRSASLSLGAIQKTTRLFGSINSYRTFFSNPIYKGILQYGDRTYPEYCDPMVSPALWDQVQAVQNNYAHRRHTGDETLHPRRTNSRFLLSGLARCGHCGSPLFGHASKRPNGTTYDSYLCTRAYRKRDCVRARIPMQRLDEIVIDILPEGILKPENLQAAYAELTHEQSERLAEQDRQRKAFNRDLASLRKQITHITDSIAQIGGSRSLHERLQDLETQETDLIIQKDKLEAAAETPVPEIPLDLLNETLPELPTLLRTADLATKRIILQGYIARIDVQREGNWLHGIIQYYYPPPKVKPPPESGGVPIVQCPSGPPRYRHTFSFSKPIKKPRSR